MFADEYIERVELEDNDNWVDIRPLGWDERDRAQKTAVLRSLQEAANVDMPEQEYTPEQIEELREAVNADPLSYMDILETLKGGIVAWSAERPVTEENIKLLDPETADLLARRIVGIRAKDNLGNSSAPSTATSPA